VKHQPKKSRKGQTMPRTPMNGPFPDFEYPDTAGYPDGMGTLDEGTRDYDAPPDLSSFDIFTDGDARGA